MLVYRVYGCDDNVTIYRNGIRIEIANHIQNSKHAQKTVVLIIY